MICHFVDVIKALGMESGAIADSQITASSEYDIYHNPKRARLHTKEAGLGIGTGAWTSLANDLNQWLQVDLGKITPVTHVATQGRNTWSPAQMVTKYKLQFSDDEVSFLFYKRQGESSDAVNINIIYILQDILSRHSFLFIKSKTNDTCQTYHTANVKCVKITRNFFLFL